MLIFVGIDPGLSGAVAAVNEKGNLVTIQDTPTITVKRGKHNRRVYLETNMLTILYTIQEAGEIQLVALEAVHAMPGQGVTSMFSMGVGSGLWTMAIAAMNWPKILPEPRVWKKAMGLATGADKAESIVRARQLVPAAGPHLARVKDSDRAEALLLAEFARRQALPVHLTRLPSVSTPTHR